MKITREARQTAKKLFQLCRLSGGGVDEVRLRAVLDYIKKEKPRNALGVLARLGKLVELELAESTAVVDSPSPISEPDRNRIDQTLKEVFGENTQVVYRESPELLGGVRIRRGSSVWDGSVQGRLAQLKKQFS